MIVLDLPPPPSVNRTRRLDKRGLGAIQAWRAAAHKLVMAQRLKPARHKIDGPFEIHVTLGEHIRTDADNILKSLIDYCRHIELITDDSPKYMRKITVEWGHAPEGCRLRLEAL